MRTSLKFVVLVGVALSVTPIFSTVFAQQTGSGSELFLEMQGMRSEIAELRDMVERQQHQMKKLQRSLDQQGRQGQSYPGQQAYHNNQEQGQQQGYLPTSPATIDASAGQTRDNSLGNTAPTNYSDPAAFPADSSVSDAGSRANSAPVVPNDVNQNDTFGTSASGAVIANPGALSSAGYSVTNDIPIEERVIGAPRVATSEPTSGSTYPPVIERRVGGTEDNVDPNAQASVLNAGFSGGEPLANTQYPIDASATPRSPSSIEESVNYNRGYGDSNVPQAAAGQGGSGVIAIPDGTGNSAPGSSASNSSFPQLGSDQSAPNVGSNQQTGDVQPQVANAQATGLSEQDYYQRGFDLLKDSKHSQAVNIFKQQISNYPQGSYADDAHYWIAESMYVNRALDDSKQYFRAIIDNYSQSPRLPDAMLKTAYIEQEQGNVIEARILLQEIIQYHPRSNAAISAKNRLPELK